LKTQRRYRITCFLALPLFLFLLGTNFSARAQSLEKVLLTATNAEDLNQVVFRYGIEKEIFKGEGINFEYRFLPANLAVSALIAKEVDYATTIGTPVQAAVRGLPLRVIAVGYDKPSFYVIAEPSVKSPKDLVGKKLAVSSLRGTAARAARASLKALGLNPDKDMTFIVVGQSSTRMLAMEAGSVEATVVPLPWNVRLRQKGFKELAFAGQYISEPFVGLVATREKIQQNHDQVKRLLRGFLRSLKAIKTERKEAVEFIARTYRLNQEIASEVYEATLQSLTKDGAVDPEILRNYLANVKEDLHLTKEVPLADVVDFRLLHEAAKEIKN